MIKKIKDFLFPALGYKSDAVDRDNDGIVQEGTKFERHILQSSTTVKKAVKKAPAKKVAKKAPAKKTSRGK